MLPDNERTGPVGNGTGSGDQLGDQVNDNADAHSVVDDAWQRVSGLLLSSPTVDSAADVLERLPAEVPNPVHKFWLTGVSLAIESLAIPNPTVAADLLMRAGIPAPPAMRGQILSSGWALVSENAGIPMACAPDFVRIIRAGEVSRRAELIGVRLQFVAWRTDPTELFTVVASQLEAFLAVAALEGVVA